MCVRLCVMPQALTDLTMLTTPTMPSASDVSELYHAALDDDRLYVRACMRACICFSGVL